jgi:hypothetical protein
VSDGLASGVDHGLDSQDHSIAEADALSLFAVVGHLWFFVQLAAQAVADQFSNHTVTGRLGMFLDGVANIPDTLSGHGLGDAAVQALAGDSKEPLGFWCYNTDPKRKGLIPDESVDFNAAIHRDDVAISHRGFAGNSMNHLIVGRDAQGIRKTVQAFESGYSPRIPDEFLGQAIQFKRAYSWDDSRSQNAQGAADQVSS